MQLSQNEQSIVAYFSTSGQVVSAGDQLRSLLQVSVPKSMMIEQVSQSQVGSSPYTSQSTSSYFYGGSSSTYQPEESDAYKMTVAVSRGQSQRAMEIIRSQGGIIK
ncbi:MAG: hypothetical protein ACM3QW_05275 [Ignavibacteriales bacterium]